MHELSAQLASEIYNACQSAAAEIAEAFGRVFDAPCEVNFSEPASWGLIAPAANETQAGLAVVMHVGAAAAVVVLPDAEKMLPAWCRAPDATGQGKLNTLAQELSALTLPETVAVDNFAAGYVERLEDALERSRPAADAMHIAIAIHQGESQFSARLIFPLQAATKLLNFDAPPSSEEVPASPDAAKTSADVNSGPVGKRMPAVDLEEGIARLPRYARSLLKIRVPVKVTLAKTKQQLSHIVELGPGSLIQFDKSCDETLELEVANQPVAVGEAVKVGDKFGLRITSVILPGERFISLRVGGTINRDDVA